MAYTEEQEERLVRALEGIAEGVARYNEIQLRYYQHMVERDASIHEREQVRAERERVVFEEQQRTQAELLERMQRQYSPTPAPSVEQRGP